MTKPTSLKSINKHIILILKKPQRAVCCLVSILTFAAIAVGCAFNGADTDEDTATETYIFSNTAPVETAQVYSESEMPSDETFGLTPDDDIIEEAEEYPYDTDFRGYITGISENTVSVDEIIWDTEGDYDNGYAIINDDTSIKEYPCASDCQFWILKDYWIPCQRLEYEVFAEFLAEADFVSVWAFALNEEGEVVMIGMQYQP